MNIVGTPYSDVHRSCCDGAQRRGRVEAGAGITMQAPCVVAPRLPITMPKQW